MPPAPRVIGIDLGTTNRQDALTALCARLSDFVLLSTHGRLVLVTCSCRSCDGKICPLLQSSTADYKGALSVSNQLDAKKVAASYTADDSSIFMRVNTLCTHHFRS